MERGSRFRRVPGKTRHAHHHGISEVNESEEWHHYHESLEEAVLKKNTGKGFSLAELIIAMAILVSVLVICSMLFTSSWRRLQTSNALQDAQNSAIIGMEKFAREFEETSAFYIANKADPASPDYNSPPYISFPSPRDTSGDYHRYPSTGDPQWQLWIVYYLEKDPDCQELYYMKKKLIPFTPDASAPSPADGGIIQVISRNVKSFKVMKNSSPESINNFEAELVTDRPYGGAHYSFQSTRTFIFDNLLRR
jgi:prepilin-type N-terminal cleavage/methylation domain-containing protein